MKTIGNAIVLAWIKRGAGSRLTGRLVNHISHYSHETEGYDLPAVAFWTSAAEVGDLAKAKAYAAEKNASEPDCACTVLVFPADHADALEAARATIIRRHKLPTVNTKELAS